MTAPRPIPADLEAVKAGRFNEDCGSCGHPFDEGDGAYLSDSLAELFCSKACAADAYSKVLFTD